MTKTIKAMLREGRTVIGPFFGTGCPDFVEIAGLAGFDFLADLPDDIENPLEAATPTRLWPAGPSGTFKLLRERFQTYD